WFVSNAIYMVTGAVLYKQSLLNTDEKLANFCETLLERSKILGWELDAWFVMQHHYHFIGRSPKDARSLKSLIQAVHSINAKFVNRIDGTPGRKVWYNYWDSCIQSEKSYRAHLNYVIMNPVKHGLVQHPAEYQFSSYRWFYQNVEPDFRELVLNESTDDENILDDF
ncbi:MAG: transposase, partial [Anaerolineales bacterium]|nr:transposase [Anaerolineales bacterium]